MQGMYVLIPSLGTEIPYAVGQRDLIDPNKQIYVKQKQKQKSFVHHRTLVTELKTIHGV